jgi:RimJ/RimL family protein N-acetyltransferase
LPRQRANAEVSRFTGSAHTVFSEERLRTFCTTRNEQTDRLDLAVTDGASGEPVGEAVLFEWDRHSRSCTFRMLLGPRGRDRGLGSEALRLIVGHGFGELGPHRVSLEVLDFNERARHVYGKAGFVVEGRRREALLHEGRWFDWIVMSVLDREWAAAHTTARGGNT